MAYATDEGRGGGSARTPELAALEAAQALRDMSIDDGRNFVAVVTDTSFQAASGKVYARLAAGSEVEVIAWSRPLAAGDSIIVTKFDNNQNSPYILQEYASASEASESATAYGLDFPAPQSSPNGRFRVHWAGTILGVETSGVATFALSQGGLAVGVGDSVAAGWVLVAASADTDSDSAIEVTVG